MIEAIRADRPPKHLSKDAKKLWRQFTNEWDFETNTLLILKDALESYDRLQSAREQIDKLGMFYETETGFIKSHPALKIEKEARSSFLRAMKMLNLDIEPPGEIGRPPGT